MTGRDVSGRLGRWIELAMALEEELGRLEIDDGRVRALLEERRGLYEQLRAATEAEGVQEAEDGGVGLRGLAATAVAADRRCIERASARRGELLQRIRDVRQRREMAAAYRRALVGGARQAPTFCDRRV